MRPVVSFLLASLALVGATNAFAQDDNYLLPVHEIESRLQTESFRILNYGGARRPQDRTQRITIQFEDSLVLLAQLARAPVGGADFNNQPRYELAAYVLQKLFLDPDDYVVPPTVILALPLAMLREHERSAPPTFDGTQSVVVVLQYWLLRITSKDFYDRDRAREDTTYARYLGNFNILTHLIRHRDANEGNFLISRSPDKPRVFSVDNGVAFESERSNRGTHWQHIRVERLPRSTVDRLRTITSERLRDLLEVLVQFEIRGTTLVPVPPGPNLDRGRGVRRSDATIQFGLTDREIRGVERRVRELLEDVDDGKVEVF